MILAEAKSTIARSPDKVFAFIDDMANTPKWNPRCVEVKQTSDGARGVGSKLQYRYKEPGREGTMDGEVVKYSPGKELVMHYVDKALDVSVEFELKDVGGQTELTHRARIEPRTFMMKLMSPMIRGATRKQTDSIVLKLKELVEQT